jgi:hypothetical protein
VARVDDGLNFRFGEGAVEEFDFVYQPLEESRRPISSIIIVPADADEVHAVQGALNKVEIIHELTVDVGLGVAARVDNRNVIPLPCRKRHAWNNPETILVLDGHL